jgi:16S rRNA (uracil1498-N3)-methyltransferase
MTPFHFSHIEGNNAFISGEEAKHCLKVMRHRVGEHVVGIDGHGFMVSGLIVETGKDYVKVEIRQKVENWGEKEQKITLAVSMLHKPDRFEWLLEKSVELGVDRIAVYTGKHTVKTGVRIDRMERILVAALKQSMRSRLPEIVEAGELKRSLPKLLSEVNLIAHGPSGQTGDSWSQSLGGASSVTLLIGPEGDFAPDELEAALQSGFLPVSLGANRLRSETAAIHLLGIAKFLMGY